jgi:hypothetical protein
MQERIPELALQVSVTALRLFADFGVYNHFHPELSAVVSFFPSAKIR